MAEIGKKRHRRVFSCTNCRRKKRRCDRGIPCGECARNGLGDCCSYEDVKPYKPKNPQYIKLEESVMKDETLSLTMDDWQFNLFEASNRMKNGAIETSLLGYNTMAGADPLTATVKNFLNKQQAFSRLWLNVISKDGMVPKEKLDQFEQKAIAHFGVKYIHRINANSSEEEYDTVRQVISAANRQHGIVFKPYGSWTQLSLLEQILLMLPPYSVVLLLVREYFKFQQKWLPILDEKKFFDELNRVVGPTIEGACVIKSLELPTDAVILATLLLAIRLSYSDVVSHGKNNASVERASILEHPVVLDSAYVANDLLKEFTFRSQCGTHGLRALMLLQTFHIFSPERGMVTDCFSPMDIMRRIHCCASAIHLDLDRTLQCSWRSRLVFERNDVEAARALWHTVLRLDVYSAVLFDRGVAIHPETHRVELPSRDKNNEAVSIFYETRSEFMALLDLISSTTPVSSKISYSQLTEKIERLEDALKEKLGRTGDYLQPLGDEKLNEKCSRFVLLVMAKSWLLTVYFSLYLFFERKGELDLSVEYLRKRLSITQRDFCFLKAGILGRIEEYFGPGSKIFLTPFLVSLMSSQVGAGGFRVRLAFTLRRLQTSEPSIQTIKTRHLCELILQNIHATEESSLELAEALGESFHFAWAVARSTRFGQRMVQDEILFDVSDDLAKTAEIPFSVEQLKGIDLVLNEASMEHKLYTDMFGDNSQDKDTSSEARELRLLNALQLEKKWLLVSQIQSHTQKCAFLHRAGVSTVAPPSSEPLETWQYDLELLQGYDPQLIMEFFSNA